MDGNGKAADHSLPTQLEIDAFLKRWLGFSTAQSRSLQAHIGGIRIVSPDIQPSALEISKRLDAAAAATHQQAKAVRELVSSIQSVAVDGGIVPLADLAEELDDTLSGLTQTILDSSSRGVLISQALDRVFTDLSSFEGSVAAIDRINKRASLLALNAKIEAARGGDAGRGFSAVAVEVRELATAVNQLAVQIKRQLASIGAGLDKTHVLLSDIPAVQTLEKDLHAPSRIKTAMRCLVEQNARYAVILKQTEAAIERIAADVSAAIAGIQFEDCARQSLDKVCRAMRAVPAGDLDL